MGEACRQQAWTGPGVFLSRIEVEEFGFWDCTYCAEQFSEDYLQQRPTHWIFCKICRRTMHVACMPGQPNINGHIICSECVFFMNA